jgi:hypothetical protein
MRKDHDSGYKFLFSTPELVRDLIIGFVPDEWLASLDYSTRERVPGSVGQIVKARARPGHRARRRSLPACCPPPLRGRGWGRGGSTFNFRHHRLQNRRGVSQYVVVPEAHYSESLSRQPGIACLVGQRFVVLSTVRFNDDTSTEMHEIDDVRANRLLAPEFHAAQAMRSQVAPEEILGVGHVLA